MGISQEQKNGMFNPISEAEIDADHLKTMLQVSGVPVKRTEPFGNADCTCGSKLRYDMCCSPRKMNSSF